MEPLHPVEVRVLGALLEKDLTTPEYYPLTLNALVNACNQKSSREPVTDYDESTVHQALATLQHRGLASRISGAGHRVEKFGHLIGQKLNLGRRELSILCILMLRGPQTVGELRGRTERMHEFSDMDEVEHVLNTLSERAEPLVAPAARGRWVHLWSGESAISEVPPETPRGGLEQRVATLEQEVADLRRTVDELRQLLQ